MSQGEYPKVEEIEFETDLEDSIEELDIHDLEEWFSEAEGDSWSSILDEGQPTVTLSKPNTGALGDKRLETSDNPTVPSFSFKTLKIPPPAPSTLLLREVERRAPEVEWRTKDGRSVTGVMLSPVRFEVSINLLLFQPMCVEIEVRFAHGIVKANGVFSEAWQEMSNQLGVIHRDVSLANFFLRGGS